MLVFSRMLGSLRRVHLLWCLIWAQAALTASAEWRLEQRTIVDGQPRYPLFPTTVSPQTWSNGGCALVYWRRHAGAVRAIAWANGDLFDDAESKVHLDGVLVSTLQKRPCPQ